MERIDPRMPTRWFLKEWRASRGWSVRELARLMETSASTVSKLETGAQAWDSSWLARAASAFGIDDDMALLRQPNASNIAGLLHSDHVHNDEKPAPEPSNARHLVKQWHKPQPSDQPRHYVQQWRKYRGYTQEQVAKMIGVTHGAIGQLERGEVNYTQPMLEAIAGALMCHPGDLVRHDPIHKDKQPARPHHIADWAEFRGVSQADLAEALGADKSVVSRWFSGSTPSTKWQEALVEVLRCDSSEALFRHPNDHWLLRFLKGRTQDEVDRIKATLETAFPRKAG